SFPVPPIANRPSSCFPSRHLWLCPLWCRYFYIRCSQNLQWLPLGSVHIVYFPFRWLSGSLSLEHLPLQKCHRTILPVSTSNRFFSCFSSYSPIPNPSLSATTCIHTVFLPICC